MSIFDIVLLGAALSMDAAAVGMANGMAEPRMSRKKTFLIALFFGVFQGGMPLLGYFGSSVFSSLVGRIAPYLSFMLLLFLGGKMLIDAASEEEERFLVRREGLRLPALTAQARRLVHGAGGGGLSSARRAVLRPHHRRNDPPFVACRRAGGETCGR